MNLKAKIYTDETAARKHLERLQWPDGPICPHCGVVNEATELQGSSTRPGVWKCRPCQKPFSVTVGTVFERSKIPLTKWLLATELLTASKKGISSHQLARMLDITYKSAWFLSHRIREAMTPSGSDAGPLGGPGKIVEADETYIGKKDGKRKHPGAGGAGHKRAVLSLVERGGKIRSFKLSAPSKNQIVGAIQANVDPASTLHTDGAQAYRFTGAVAKHESVDHKDQYVRQGDVGSVHTNTLEGFFSVFKRGMVGTYQHCGEQHLQRYLAEFDFRQNNRAKLGINDTMRAEIALKGIAGKRLTYRRSVGALKASIKRLWPSSAGVVPTAMRSRLISALFGGRRLGGSATRLRLRLGREGLWRRLQHLPQNVITGGRFSHGVSDGSIDAQD